MENIKIEKQENEEEMKNMENTTIDTQKTEKELIKIGETVVDINEYKTKIRELSKLFVPLNVPYDDLNVLVEDTEALRLVNDFFESISHEDKGIEILLYGIIGNSVAKTTKPNKAFVLKRKSAETGKSAFLRIPETLVGNYASHEHLENLCGTKAGGKNTVEKLMRTNGKYC